MKVEEPAFKRSIAFLKFVIIFKSENLKFDISIYTYALNKKISYLISKSMTSFSEAGCDWQAS
ncbi:MAG TPA: hypothetical protein VGO21_02810, partial [Candidatus Paceibacterota bacterium]|nr:hypothetical protein [Candidatus Paceibacterota bacterium]